MIWSCGKSSGMDCSQLLIQSVVPRLATKIGVDVRELRPVRFAGTWAERDRDQFRAELDATAAKVASLEANSCPSSIRPENCPMNATDFDYLNLPRCKDLKGDPKGD